MPPPASRTGGMSTSPPPHSGFVPVGQSGQSNPFVPASAVADAFFSPSKAAEQQFLANEWARVDAWLERVYSASDPDTTMTTAAAAARVPQFERNEGTLHALQMLMNANDRAERDADVALAVVEDVAAGCVSGAAGVAPSSLSSSSPSSSDQLLSSQSLSSQFQSMSIRSPPTATASQPPPASSPSPSPATTTTTVRSTATSILETVSDALPPPYRRQLDALARLVVALGLPVRSSVDDVSSANDVGAPDIEALGHALVGHDLFLRNRQGGNRGRKAGTTGDGGGGGAGSGGGTAESANPAADPTFPFPVVVPASTVERHFDERERMVREMIRLVRRTIRDDAAVVDGGRDGDDDGAGRNDGDNDDDEDDGAVDLDAIHIETAEINRQTGVLNGKIDEYTLRLARKQPAEPTDLVDRVLELQGGGK